MWRPVRTRASGRPRQDSNLRHLVPETSALSPELRRPHPALRGCATLQPSREDCAIGRSYRSRRPMPDMGASACPGAPIPLPGDSRAALHRDRRRADDADHRGCDHPGGRRPDECDGGAPATEGPRRLRDERGPAAGQEGRDEPARVRRARPAAARAGRRDRRGRHRRARASSTSRSPPAPRASSRRRSSTQGRRTARATRSPARRSTWSSSRPTRPARCTSAASAGRRSATPWAGSSTMAGADVTREYYFNDHGAQIDRFSSSLLAAAKGRAGARGRLRRRVHRTRSPRPSSRSGPSVLDLPDDAGPGDLPRRGRRA